MLATIHQSIPRSVSSDSSFISNKIQTDCKLVSCNVYDTVDNPELRKLIGEPYASEEEIFKIMKYECNRLISFKDKWPVNEIKPESLAGAGLFYLQQEDRVQCPFCHVILYNWTSADKPLREHMKKSPRCPFLMGADNTGNIPLTSKQNKQIPVRPDLTRQCSQPSTSVDYKPKHPGMADTKRRLLTYSSWPLPYPIPQVLAECGLYYSGVADVVTCFFCGGSLGNWEPNDDPWCEHSKFFPDCAFLSLAASRKNGKTSKIIASCEMKFMKPKGNFATKDRSPDITTDIMQEALNIFPKPLVMDAVKKKGGNLFSLQELCDDILSSNKNQKSELTPEVFNAETVSSSVIENGTTENAYALLCKICMDRERGAVFQPCGHFLSCWNCAQLIADCPICRRPILHVIKIYCS